MSGHTRDRQFVDDFLDRVIELAQEHIVTQSKFTADQLLELGGFRFSTKMFRPKVKKVNPFNLFLHERKAPDNAELRKPAPGKPGVNMGCPTYTEAYAKKLAEEYKLSKPEYQQKAKELSEAPTSTLKTESALQAHRKLMKKATVFAQELARHDVHHIIMMVPQSVSLVSKVVSSVAFGEIFYKILTTKGVNGQDFHLFCRGNELEAGLEKAANVKELTRDALRKRVTTLLLDKLSKLKMTEDHISSECLTVSRCFPNRFLPCPVSTGETRRRACFTRLEVGGSGGLRSIAGRDHCQVAELRSKPSGGGLQRVARRRVEANASASPLNGSSFNWKFCGFWLECILFISVTFTSPID
jgi:hypothetical protein